MNSSFSKNREIKFLAVMFSVILAFAGIPLTANSDVSTPAATSTATPTGPHISISTHHHTTVTHNGVQVTKTSSYHHTQGHHGRTHKTTHGAKTTTKHVGKNAATAAPAPLPPAGTPAQ